MKQTISISLSGVAFTIEEDGYIKLNNYLESIKSSYGNPSDADELVNDIEARVAELILDKQPSSMPISEKRVDEIIEQLGFPISEDEEEGKQFRDANRILTKRLYRDPKEGVFGGVCSGIAKYFNIDPTVVRLITLITSISGIVPLLYLLLWIVVPKASTPRQVLEMRGEPITRKGIESFIKTEMQNMEQNIKRVTKSEKSTTIMLSIIVGIGQVLKVIFCALGVLIMIGLACGMIATAIYVIYESQHIYRNFVGNMCVNSIMVGLTAIIPQLIFFLLLIRAILRLPVHKAIYITLTLIWAISIVYLATFAILKEFRMEVFY